ncbi:hypothetical protein M878_20850 [Streptomyces roseochromogenus subsp. oscitans DS 12.976]|uniref:ABC transporter domain-containing protein n=2 Tax=Streptomyces roseochromogenus TaxID=285450 RepID=V6KB15_STRRC|nr:hypothetical protein M878_20850 [Streptomyces roseochromogenus subsp. oscitans DS 12.976]
MRRTVRENLTYAWPHAPQSEILDVVEAAHLAEVIAGLPQGLDTELGEDGIGLSDGQRQLLAIARALLPQPDVLLLDEATANLDSNSEAALCKATTDIGTRCQILVIAHRISTTIGADRILVIEDGCLRATGTHTELMEHNATYRHLASQQLTSAGAVHD